MKRILVFLLCSFLCLTMAGCGASQDDSALQAQVDSLTQENKELREKVDALEAELAQIEAKDNEELTGEEEPTPLAFVADISAYLSKEFSIMKYMANELTANPFNSNELQLPIRLKVGSDIENTGINIYFGVSDESAVIDSLALYASTSANTIYFNNVLSAFLHTARDIFSLDISNDTIDEKISSMTDDFASGNEVYSGLSDEGYSILMRLSTDEFGLDTYVVSVSTK